MEVASLGVKKREERGRKQIRAVRQRSEIPAVVYGRGGANLHLSIPGHEFTQLVMTHHKLFDLLLEGGQKEEAYLQEVQWDPLDDSILHADFMRIDLGEKMQTEVDLHYVGQPKGLAKGGIFDTVMQALRIECLPKDLPEEIRVNVNDLDVGDSIHVSDLPLPAGVVSLDQADLLVCQCKLRHESLAEEEEAPPEEGTEPEVIGKEKKEDEEDET